MEEQVSDDATLSAREIAAGFVLLTKDEWRTIRDEHAAAFEVWAAATATAQKQSETTKRTEVHTSVAEVETAMKEWQTSDEKARGDVLLKLLHTIVQALRDLGADLPAPQKRKQIL